MLVPSIFSENFFDDWMDSSFANMRDVDRQLYGKNANRVMKTDVRELDDHYEVDIDLPIVLETEGVEGVEGEHGLAEINATRAFRDVDVVEVEPKVLFLHVCRGVERPNAYSWRCRKVCSDGVHWLFEVDVFDERGVAVGEVGPLRDGVLAPAVRS